LLNAIKAVDGEDAENAEIEDQDGPIKSIEPVERADVVLSLDDYSAKALKLFRDGGVRVTDVTLKDGQRITSELFSCSLKVAPVLRLSWKISMSKSMP
jgi:hypothetical protein